MIVHRPDIETLIRSLSPAEMADMLAMMDEIESRKRIEAARIDFLAFIALMDRTYKFGSHLKRLGRLLMDVEVGQKDRIAVSMAPRFGKSQMISIYFPAWYLGRNPEHKVIVASHTADLAVDMARKVRNLMKTEEYRRIFPDTSVAEDAKAAGKWNTSKGGEYFACLRPTAMVHTDRGRIPAVEVRVGDQLQNAGGLVTVQQVYPSTHEATYTVRGLQCSAEHPIWTFNRGWVFAKHLVAEDLLCTESFLDRMRSLFWRLLHGPLEHPDVPPLVQPQISLHQPQQREVGAVRRARSDALRALAYLRKFFAGHGEPAKPEPHDRPYRRQRAVQPRELPVGDSDSASKQSAEQCPVGGENFSGARPGAGNNAGNGSLPDSHGGRPAVSNEAPTEELQTYDPPKSLGWLRCSVARNLTHRSKSDKPNEPGSWAESYLARAGRAAAKLLGVLVGVRSVGVIAIETHAPTPFVNFLTDGDHTFFVDGVLTHNCGVGGALAGRGAHLIVADDILSEQDIKAGNTASLDVVYEWFRAGLRTRLMPGGRIAVLHTRWHMRDVIGRLTKDAALTPDADQYEVFEFPAILNEGTENEKSLWPEQWSLESLLRTKASMPLWQWNAQYQQALALDTPVPTPTGWTTIGELQPGDFVFGADGKPVQVVWVSPVYPARPSYFVETDDGACIHADENHLWEVQTTRADGPAMVRTTKWLFDRQERRASKGGAKRRPRIRQSEAWDLPPADLPLDPYVLGAWLGDGTKSCAQFTSSDEDAAWWATEFTRLGYGLTKYKKAYSYQINGAMAGLRAAGVVGNKHVPVAYLRGSKAQRLALLQGLMDTDGHCSRGQAQFANTNLKLVRAVEELALSLGAKPCTTTFEPAGGRGKLCYKVQFYMEDAFRMPRKAAGARGKLTKHGRFVSIRPAPSVDTRCIRVANPDGLFLAGERCLVTHNCPTAAESAIIKREWIRWWPHRDPPAVDFIIQSWDTALTTKERSDWSVCQTWGVWTDEQTGASNVILLNSAKGKWEFPDLKQEAHEQYLQWQPDSVIIEAKASGQPLIDEMRRSGIFVQDFSPGKGHDKIARLNAVADMFSAGHVWFPETPWAQEVVEELLEFPAGLHDDQVDALTLALRRARTGGLLRLATDREDNEYFPSMRRKGAYTV